MDLARYLLRRLLFALALIFVVSSAALLLTLVAPGGFVSEECLADPEQCRKQVAELGLDRPVLTQYVDWLGRAVRFDFGRSTLYSRPVGDLLGERALNTSVLATVALLGATIVGIPLGIYTGSRTRSLGSTFVTSLSLLLLSTPPLLASLALVLLAVKTGWLPVGGMTSAATGELSWLSWTRDVARHVTLPALALALPLAATLERLQSQSIASALREPFVSAARARGLSKDRALLAHGWRVSLGALLGIYGLMIGSLFSGSFIVEVVTAWPGLGRLMFDALRARDIFLVAGSAATGALCLAASTFLTDVLLAVADPRVTQSTRA